jgi:protein SCO1/2
MIPNWLSKRSLPAVLAGVLACVFAPSVAGAKPVSADEIADRTEPLPQRLEGVDIQEKLEAALPRSLTFKEDGERTVVLGDFVDGTVPVILTFNYSSCPMLCSLQLNALVESLKQVDKKLGTDFRIVTIILDPDEKASRTKETKSRYMQEYGQLQGAAAWHFLTGSREQIRKAADAVGISYGYNEKRDEYVHPAALVMLTPQGKVARYLYGVEYHPRTVELSLVEVAQGKIGSPFEKLLLFCFHYDEQEGSYAPVAMNIMRISAGLGTVVLGGVLMSFWLAENRKRKLKARKPGSPRSAAS